MPAPLRVGTPLREETVVWSLTELGRQRSARASSRRARFVCARSSKRCATAGEMTAADLLSATESTPEALRKLEARGYVDAGEARARSRAP